MHVGLRTLARGDRTRQVVKCNVCGPVAKESHSSLTTTQRVQFMNKRSRSNPLGGTVSRHGVDHGESGHVVIWHVIFGASVQRCHALGIACNQITVEACTADATTNCLLETQEGSLSAPGHRSEDSGLPQSGDSVFKTESHGGARRCRSRGAADKWVVSPVVAARVQAGFGLPPQC